MVVTDRASKRTSVLRGGLLAVLLLSLAAEAAELPDYGPLTGTYEGHVFNGGDLDPVVTTFEILPDGRLRGHYYIDEETGPVEGIVTNVYLLEGRAYSVEWTDKHGEGQAVLSFSADFSSFNGYWIDGLDGSSHPWTGVKQ